MTVLSHQSIKERCERFRLISPYSDRAEFEGMTFGCGPASYDFRIAQDVVLRPLEFKLASTIERFSLQDDIRGVVLNKSSWARLGLDASATTNAEPGWCGFLTLELFNKSSETLRIKAGSPIAQMEFELLDEPTIRPYRGRYQDQPNRPIETIFGGDQ